MSTVIPIDLDSPIGEQFRQIRLRQQVELSQVAETMGVEAWQVANIESTSDLEIQLTTLRSYVSAIGGRLTCKGNFPGEVSLDI